MDQLNFATDILPHILSAVTLYVMWLAGKGNPNAWLLGMANQVLWTAFAISTKTYGLLWLNVALLYVYWDNYKSWKNKTERENAEEISAHSGRSE